MKRIMLFGLLAGVGGDHRLRSVPSGLLLSPWRCGAIAAPDAAATDAMRVAGQRGPRYGRSCGARHARVYADCGDDCCPDCGRPLRERNCRSCGTCGDCGCECMDPCGECSYGRPWHRGPLSCMFALFTPAYWCGRGCGERYWGDFYSDPPDCWDPCDCHGNYTGGCRHCGGGYGDGG